MKFIEHVEGLISSKAAIVKSFWTLLKLETRLASRSMLPLLANFGLSLALIITIWFNIIFLAGYLLFLWTGSTLIALSSILVVNCSVLFYSLWRIKVYGKRLSFEKTRACLSTHETDEKRDNYEHKKITGIHSPDRKKTTSRRERSGAA